MSGRKRKSPDLQKTCLTEKPHGPFARVYDDLFHSEIFQDLTPTARNLYIDMILQAKGEKEFVYPRRIYKSYYSAAAFQAAKDQLVKSGFISEKKYFKAETVYELSAEWKKRSRQKKPP